MLQETGRRVSCVRLRGGGDAGSDVDRDTGERKWKMGAREWGVRKVAVARQEGGGMYAFYGCRR